MIMCSLHITYSNGRQCGVLLAANESLLFCSECTTRCVCNGFSKFHFSDRKVLSFMGEALIAVKMNKFRYTYKILSLTSAPLTFEV